MERPTTLRLLFIAILIAIFLFATPFGKSLYQSAETFRLSVGDPVDSLNGVVVYYNGRVSHSGERHKSNDGYNFGIKYQCVEFVKRYYFLRLNHRMPDTYGNAKDFFDGTVQDGKLNKTRNLTQYVNGSSTKPAPDDLLVYSETRANPYGHVSIVAGVSDNSIEIIQQNPGAYSSSRATFSIDRRNGKWYIDNDRILGWLRKAR